MSKRASEFTGTAGAESIAYSEANLKFKSVKDIPDTAHVRKHDRGEAHVIWNCVGYEYTVDKLGNDVMVRVLEIDTVSGVKVTGRMTEPMPVPEPTPEGQTRVDTETGELLDAVVDHVNSGALDDEDAGITVTASRGGSHGEAEAPTD